MIGSVSFEALLGSLSARPGLRGREFERICKWFLLVPVGDLRIHARGNDDQVHTAYHEGLLDLPPRLEPVDGDPRDFLDAPVKRLPARLTTGPTGPSPGPI